MGRKSPQVAEWFHSVSNADEEHRLTQEEVAMRKREARERCLALRSSLDPAYRIAADRDISRHVLESSPFASSPALLTYLSMPGEVDTRAIIAAALEAAKVVALPRCVPGRRMEWHVVTSLDGLVRSRFGVEEPDGDPATLLDSSLMGQALALVPGLAFDRSGHRLGYGGGYYDVFLSSFEGATLGLCRTEQLADSLASAGLVTCLDLPVGAVATPAGILRL